MRLLTAVVFVAALFAVRSPSCGDGVFVEKAHVMDPSSHARDITEPQQKAFIIYSEGVEQLILQVSFKGNAADFAWVIPTPARPKVFPVYAPVFHWLRSMTDPGLRHYSMFFPGPSRSRQGAGPARLPDVDVLQEDTVGVYDVSVLRAGNANDLFQWLRNRDYQVSAALVPLVGDYIKRGWVFTAVRVSTASQKKAAAKLEEGVLQSLKLVFPASEPVYPLKISSLNGGVTEVLLYVVAPGWVSAAGWTTDCRLEFLSTLSRARLFSDDASSPYRILYDWNYYWNNDVIAPDRLTKLRATLSPEQMTDDVVLKTDEALQALHPTPPPTPLLAEVGLTAMALLALTLSTPLGMLLLLVACMSLVGRLSWRYWFDWIVYGIFFWVMWLVVLSGFLTLGPGEGHLGKRETESFAAIGFIALLAAGCLLTVLVISVVRRRRQAAGNVGNTEGVRDG